MEPRLNGVGALHDSGNPMRRALSSAGATDSSPWRKPWESDAFQGQPRHGAKDPTYAPPGLSRPLTGFPGLTAWAVLFRPDGRRHDARAGASGCRPSRSHVQRILSTRVKPQSARSLGGMRENDAPLALANAEYNAGAAGANRQNCRLPARKALIIRMFFETSRQNRRFRTGHGAMWREGKAEESCRTSRRRSSLT